MGFFKKVFGSKSQSSGLPQETPVVRTMHTLASAMLTEPFGEINYWELPDGGKRVRAYILMEHPIEGMQTGVAVDGSASMQKPFGRVLQGQASERDVELYRRRGLVKFIDRDGRRYKVWSQEALDELLARGVFRYMDNIVEPQVQEMADYLSKFDADGGTTVIYWATGDGREIQFAGDLTGAECHSTSFPGPQKFGNGTHLLPAIKYFVERFTEPPWGLYIFITDGVLDDLNEVKRYCVGLAREIAGGKRNPLKFVLIGVGDECDERQMEALDDLETGTDVDLWDHKIAREMKQLSEIFAEAVSASVVIAPGMGVVKDAQGNMVKDYRDTGLPALLWFDLSSEGAGSFSLDVGGQVVTQAL
ncbi:MAG: VWA domain-containing protein [Anaerolineae bacterium]|nr:VWA domain-containing protein [Anaerolineae bacterium]